MNEYMTVKETKIAIRTAGYIVKDTSGHPSYGYDFAIFRRDFTDASVCYVASVGDALVNSVTVYEPETLNAAKTRGAYRAVFRRAEVEALLNTAAAS